VHGGAGDSAGGAAAAAAVASSAPTPDIYDEFGHLLAADTLRHFRLANPMHPMHQFFETFFALQEPSYSSIYPIGQGLALPSVECFRTAVGWRAAFHGGVLRSVLLDAAGLDTPGWALTGGCLAVIEFGPLNRWTNTYSAAS